LPPLPARRLEGKNKTNPYAPSIPPPPNATDAKFRNTGLERTAALTQDLAFMASEYGVSPPEPQSDGPGNTYASFLRGLAKDDAPAFICHYYNFYFAHTAGGRMIGAKVSSEILGGKELAFYEYGAGQDVAALLDSVRASINDLAEGWDAGQKERCLAETASSFKWSGQLLRLITETA
jgi:heme oxygenase (biliverdin-producing, ferredoxin)